MNDSTSRPRRALPGQSIALRIGGVLEKLEDAATVAIVVVMFLLIFGQVVARYVIPLPLFWVEELARTGMVWLTFIAAGLVTSRLGHLAVTAVSDRVPPRGRRIFLVAAEVSIFASAIALIPATWHVFEAVQGANSSSGIMPRSALFLGPLIGWGLMAVHALINVLYKDLDATSPEVTD